MKNYYVMTIISLFTLLSLQVHASYNALSISEVKTLIVEQAEQKNIAPALALAIAKVESDFNPLATSSAGARGVMQILPKTAEDVFGVSKDRLYHAQTNIDLGLSFIKQLLAKYDQRLDIALSHYNGGSAVQGENGNLHVIPNTQGYVDKVLAYYRQFDIKPYYSPFNQAHNQHTVRAKEYPYKVGEIHNAIKQQVLADEKAAELASKEQAVLVAQSNQRQGISIKGPKQKKVSPAVVNYAQFDRNQYASARNSEQANVQVQAYPQIRQINSVVSWQDQQPVNPVIQIQKRKNEVTRSVEKAHENQVVSNYLQGKTRNERKTQVSQWESIFN